MALGKTAIRGGLAALMVAVMTAGAFAWEAYATNALNVRSGPGTNYGVVTTLQRHQVVDVQYCRSGWCFLDTGRYGRTGWASQNYLREVGNWAPPRPNPPSWQPPRPTPPSWHPNPPRPPFWGNNPPRPPHWNNPRPPHWNPAPPPRPRPDSQVCFNGPNGYFCIGN